MNSGERIVKWIKIYSRSEGYSPTFREVAAGAQVSLSTTYYWLHKLKREGVLTFKERRSRTIRLLGDQR